MRSALAARRRVAHPGDEGLDAADLLQLATAVQLGRYQIRTGRDAGPVEHCGDRLDGSEVPGPVEVVRGENGRHSLRGRPVEHGYAENALLGLGPVGGSSLDRT